VGFGASKIRCLQRLIVRLAAKLLQKNGLLGQLRPRKELAANFVGKPAGQQVA
jgi:hypothetical protein